MNSVEIKEIPEKMMVDELNRRIMLRDAGKCDYCGLSAETNPLCKYPDRHNWAKMSIKFKKTLSGVLGVAVIGLMLFCGGCSRKRTDLDGESVISSQNSDSNHDDDKENVCRHCKTVH